MLNCSVRCNRVKKCKVHILTNDLKYKSSVIEAFCLFSSIKSYQSQTKEKVVCLLKRIILNKY